MHRVVLHISRRYFYWCDFTIQRAHLIPLSIHRDLLQMGFQEIIPKRSKPNGTTTTTTTTTTTVLYRTMNGKKTHQWNLAVDLVGLGFNFISPLERENCLQGKTSLMDLHIKSDNQGLPNNSGVVLNVYQNDNNDNIMTENKKED